MDLWQIWRHLGSLFRLSYALTPLLDMLVQLLDYSVEGSSAAVLAALITVWAWLQDIQSVTCLAGCQNFAHEDGLWQNPHSEQFIRSPALAQFLASRKAAMCSRRISPLLKFKSLWHSSTVSELLRNCLLESIFLEISNSMFKFLSIPI